MLQSYVLSVYQRFRYHERETISHNCYVCQQDLKLIVVEASIVIENYVQELIVVLIQCFSVTKTSKGRIINRLNN
jgi:hypothetical protein